MVAKPVIYINTDYFLLNNFAYRKKVVIILEYAFNLIQLDYGKGKIEQWH